jgi:hypothetical protein
VTKYTLECSHFDIFLSKIESSDLVMAAHFKIKDTFLRSNLNFIFFSIQAAFCSKKRRILYWFQIHWKILTQPSWVKMEKLQIYFTFLLITFFRWPSCSFVLESAFFDALTEVFQCFGLVAHFSYFEAIAVRMT